MTIPNSSARHAPRPRATSGAAVAIGIAIAAASIIGFAAPASAAASASDDATADSLTAAAIVAPAEDAPVEAEAPIDSSSEAPLPTESDVETPVDAEPPASDVPADPAPEILPVDEHAFVAAPVFDTPSMAIGPTAAVTGTGVVGATVHVSIYQGALIGTAVVAEDGRWSVIPTTPLAHGINRLSAYQSSVDGDSMNLGGIVLVHALVDPPTAVGPEGEQNLSEPVELVGTGEPGATIEVRDDAGTVVCSTTVEADGTWTCVIPALEDRDQDLSVTQTDRVGNVSTPVAVSIHKTSAPGPQPGDGSAPETGPQPASGAAADPISPSDASAPLTAPARAAALAATGGEVDGILLGAGGLLLVAGILSLAIPRRRVQ
ncbi:Ig-like domain-containing protein [Microbacterium sp. CGR1]|uniref:Ig-like domain-containing protein n=1 Tax=Microbacterium sp. CGR1 TaxID=1696072 RepID=UPI003DA3A3E6